MCAIIQRNVDKGVLRHPSLNVEDLFRLSKLRMRLEFFTSNLFFLLFSVLIDLVHPQQLRYNKGLSKDVTNLLDSLLREDKYDKRFRPHFGGRRFFLHSCLLVSE